MKLHVLLITAVCALGVAPSVASAQTYAPTSTESPWLKDRRYTEGAGYRVGDLELHPGLAGEFGYDSNYLLRAPNENPAGALHLKITPSLSLSTISSQRKEAGGPPPDYTFRGGLNATYHEFIPVSGNDQSKTDLRNARNVSGALDLALGIMPGHTWGGNINGSLTRLVLPSEQGNTGNYNRVLPGAGAEIVYQPGGGLLDWRLGYTFLGALFEDQTQFTNYNNEVFTRGRWRFLPRTALTYDGRFGFITYSDQTVKTNSHPVRARIGINGLVTQSFGVLAMVGWGSSFYTPTGVGQGNFDSVIGQLELKYYLTPNPSTNPGAATLSLSSVAVGFTRDFADSYIGTYYERDRGYLNLSYFFSGQFLLVLEGGAAAIRYPSIIKPVVHGGWNDTRIDGSLFGEYRVKDSIGINLTFRYDQNISSQVLTAPGGAGGDNLAYSRFQALLGLRWFM